MRGSGQRSGELFSSVDLEKRVRADHPLRAVRKLTDAAVAASSAEFAALYWGLGRPSVAPEKLLRAMLLQAFYALRSERQLIERLEYDLLFRWFVGLGVDDPVWDHSTFSKNRDRLLEGSARSTVPRPSRRRAVRNGRSRPLVEDLGAWLRARNARLSAKSKTANTIEYR